MKTLVVNLTDPDADLSALGTVTRPWPNIPGAVLLETDKPGAEVDAHPCVECCADAEREFKEIASQPIFWHGPDTSVVEDGRWGLVLISSPKPLQGPWPKSMAYSYDTTGAGCIAYMMDGAPGELPQLAGRLTIIHNGHPSAGPGNHGTAVAAIMGGTRDGVAKGAQIRAAVVTGANGSGTLSQMYSGGDAILADYAGRTEPAAVNMSIAGEGATNPLSALLSAFRDAGLLVVAGAGNNGRDIGAQPIWPASASNVLTVGAMTVFHTRASFSNYGAPVDLWAAGDDENVEGWGIRAYYAAGTSFASPDVVGLACRLMEGRARLTPSEVVALEAEILGHAIDDAIMPAGTTTKRAYLPGAPVSAGAQIRITITA